METRESLLQNLYEAKNIIQQAEEVTQRYNDTKGKLLNRQVFVDVEKRTGTKVKNTIGKVIATILFGFFGFLTLIVLFASLSAPYKEVRFSAIVWVVIYIIALLLYIRHLGNRDKWYKQINRSGQMATDAENQRRAQINAQIEKEAELINAEMQEIRRVADERLTWYPRNYCYSEAVMFFISAIQNFRADSLKEAVNLYVEELQHRQVLDNQKQILNKQEENIRQQKVNNVLSAMNLFTNLSIKSAVKDNTAAVNSNTNAVYNNTAAVNAAKDAIKKLKNYR